MKLPEGLRNSSQNHCTFSCPHCGVVSTHQKIVAQDGYCEGAKVTGTLGGDMVLYAAFQHFLVSCSNCKKDTYFLYRSDFTHGDFRGDRFGLPMGDLVHQFPVSTPASHPSVPNGVKSASIEVEKCLSVGAFNACGVMTRRAIIM